MLNPFTGAITGTPTAAVLNTPTFKVTDSSSPSLAKSANLTLTINALGIVSVTISPKRSGLAVNQSLPFTATVTNDSGNAGATWSLTGGTFTGQSKTTTSFHAAAAGVYTITAASIADSSKSASASVAVTDLAAMATYHNDLARDGVNASEYALTTALVNKSTFGKLFSCAVDAPLYAQPLCVAGLSIGGGTHNVIFAASSHDTVYAFDADAITCGTFWNKPLLGTGESFLASSDVGTNDITPDIGIVGTPVIDPASKTLYVVSKSKDSTSNYHQRLHALNLIDGSEKFSGPVDLISSLTVPGTGDGSSGGNVPFNPLRLNQRPGLALVNGIVYAAWASHGDNGPYYGWVIGFDKSTLAIVSKFNSSPNGRQGGIWMSGGAPAADAGTNLYLLTGNGDYDGTNDFGDSFLKLSTASGLTLSDWFTPFDQSTLDNGDLDLGSGGAVVLVDLPSGAVQHLLIGGGKAGSGNSGQIYVLNRDNLGHNQSGSDSQIVQTFPLGSSIFSTGTFWNGTLFMTGAGGPLTAFALNTKTSKFNPTPIWQSISSYGFPGATPSVSASGTSNGIVWALNNNQYGPPCCSNGLAVLHAYDAATGTELWNSTQAASNRDKAGNAVKFTVPTVANGKVYVGTRTELSVYGLLPN